MASGPEHYRAAERLTQEKNDCRNGDPACHFCARALAEAQVHATLALADFFRAWTEVYR